jgi:acylphosphatase
MAVVRVEVSGAVQGVGFRWFTREVARRHGLAGWVRNREDGSVEIAASGTSEAIERFLEEVRRGPSGAYVEELRHLPTDSLTSLQHPFSIVR